MVLKSDNFIERHGKSCFLFKIVENGVFKNVDGVAGKVQFVSDKSAVRSLDYPQIFHVER